MHVTCAICLDISLALAADADVCINNAGFLINVLLLLFCVEMAIACYWRSCLFLQPPSLHLQATVTTHLVPATHTQSGMKFAVILSKQNYMMTKPVR